MFLTFLPILYWRPAAHLENLPQTALQRVGLAGDSRQKLFSLVLRHALAGSQLRSGPRLAVLLLSGLALSLTHLLALILRLAILTLLLIVLLTVLRLALLILLALVVLRWVLVVLILLILLALARVQRGETRLVEFTAIDAPLQQLLAEFGPSSAAKSRHYPFWHLATDGHGALWDLSGPREVLNRPAGATPSLGELRSHHIKAVGRLPQPCAYNWQHVYPISSFRNISMLSMNRGHAIW